MKPPNLIVILVTLVVLGLVNTLIIQKELLIANGRPVYLELAPVDPRSLMQGDYMRLDYDLPQRLDPAQLQSAGRLVISIDNQGVAQFVRIHEPGQPLAPGELLIDYHIQSSRVMIGPDAFFFQERHAEYYENARYGEVRISPAGEVTLVGLRGPQLERLGAPVDQVTR